jgi:hypothetical protein
VVGAVLPVFQKRIVHRQPDFKTGEIAPCRFLKALGAAPRHLSSNRSKGFELAGFEKLSANSKAFWCKTAKNLLIQYQVKGTETRDYNWLKAVW